MNFRFAISATITLMATIAIYAMPYSVKVEIGDPAARVHEIGRYGYPKSQFNLARRFDEDGKLPEPAAFSIGGGWHLLIWYTDRIKSMTHFRYEDPPIPNTYGQWREVQKVESFTVKRPSTIPFLVGMASCAFAGALLAGFSRTFYVLLTLLSLFAALMIATLSQFAGTFAIFPALCVLGWVAAALSARYWRRVSIDKIQFLDKAVADGNAI